MKLILSRTMGYCKGVSRALDLAVSALADAKEVGKPVYSLGKLIHNDDTCAYFADQGMQIIAGSEGHEQDWSCFVHMEFLTGCVLLSWKPGLTWSMQHAQW